MFVQNKLLFYRTMLMYVIIDFCTFILWKNCTKWWQIFFLKIKLELKNIIFQCRHHVSTAVVLIWQKCIESFICIASVSTVSALMRIKHNSKQHNLSALRMQISSQTLSVAQREWPADRNYGLLPHAAKRNYSCKFPNPIIVTFSQNLKKY